MPTIIGKRGDTIEEQNHNRVFSKVEIIGFSKDSYHIDFRNELKPVIDSIEKGTIVKVDFLGNAKLSKMKKSHNNDIATSIEKL